MLKRVKFYLKNIEDTKSKIVALQDLNTFEVPEEAIKNENLVAESESDFLIRIENAKAKSLGLHRR